MEDLYFSILEKAEKRGLFILEDISEDVKKHLKKSYWVKEKIKPKNWQSFPETLFGELAKLDYIHIVVGKLPEVDQPPDNWIDLLMISIAIKPQGLLFLYQRKSIKSAQRGLLFTKISICLTAVFSLAALGFTIANYRLSSNSNVENERLLQLKVTQQEQLLKVKQAQIDSLVLKMAHLPGKPNPKSK